MWMVWESLPTGEISTAGKLGKKARWGGEGEAGAWVLVGVYMGLVGDVRERITLVRMMLMSLINQAALQMYDGTDS